MMEIEKLRFLTKSEVCQIAQIYGTPVFVYSRKEIEEKCDQALAFPNEFGVTVRYALKANPNSTILRIMRKKGIHIDASSEYEVERAILAGFKPEEIMLTSQEPAKNLKSIVERGVFFNACSLHQMEEFGKLFPGKELSIRINPGFGSGGTTKTNVGGSNSSFGIWHEYIPDVKIIITKYKLRLTKIHTHIGSGSDPEAWKGVASYTLRYAAMFPECTTVNLGGGFKVGRMRDEKSTDFQVIGIPVKEQFAEFARTHARKLKLEIEPGTFMMANAGCLITRVEDIVDTGKEGFEFVKLNSGMDTNTRPSLYGARHPLVAVSPENQTNGSPELKEYVVVGHCCESGDVFTQKMGGDPETRLIEKVAIGDFVAMEGCGAYCAGMSTKNYNSFPETAEILKNHDGSFRLIRKRQALEQMMENELNVEI